MALLSILRYPDPRLHTVAKPVTQFDDAFATLIQDMTDTMYQEHGVGLAATQVDVHLQVVVIDTSETHDSPQVFINPKITAKSGSALGEEGCLSVPHIYEKVERAEVVTVEALDAHGKPFTVEADGLLAVCLQHELDHLAGKVFVERLSALKQNRIKTKLKKRERNTM